MKVNSEFIKKFLLVGVAVYLASLVVFLTPNILEWPIWYRAVLGVIFVLGIAVCITENGDSTYGYSRKFWRDQLEIITAFSNLEDIEYRHLRDGTWYKAGENHCFTARNEYRLSNPTAKTTNSTTDSKAMIIASGDSP